MKNTLVIKYLVIGCCFLVVFGGGMLLYPVLKPQVVAGKGGYDSPVLPLLASTENFPFVEDTGKVESEDDILAEASALSYTAYRIKKGDMIGVIAEEFGLTQDTLISVNNIRMTRLIQPGQ